MNSAAKPPATPSFARRRHIPSLVVALIAASLLLGALGSPVFADDHSQPAETTPSSQPAPGAKPSDRPAGDGEEALDPAEQRLENVIAASRQYLGVPYRVGSEGPNLFDCSGLVFRAFSDAGLVDRISGNRLRAAGYMRWFARQGLMTANEEEAQRGDLVVYNGGKHIGIYLGDGRTISALVTGVTVHGLHGISQAVTGFLRPDWTGESKVAPFVPVELPEVAEEPAVLVPAVEWMPALDETTVLPIAREGVERVDMRTLTSRTWENEDGTFTTEFHAQPIHYLPADAEELAPIDLRFVENEKTKDLAVATSPVIVRARAGDARGGLLSATSGELVVSLALADKSAAQPTLAEEGAAVDYFDLLPQGVGLRALARPDGFKAFLVLDKDPGRNRFTFVLDAPGLTPVLDELSGDIVLNDEAGLAVARLPRPLLMDASDADGTGGGLFSAAADYELAQAEDGRTLLTVAVRKRFIEEAVYPAYLDISVTGFPAAMAPADVTFASSRHSDSTLAGYQRPDSVGFGELWLGHQPRSRNDNEIYMRFNGLRAALGTVDVASASLELMTYWQRSGDVAALVRRVATEWTAETLTWNARPEPGVELGELSATAGQWAALDVSEYATDTLSRGVPDFGLSLYGAEDATGTWKRLTASDGADPLELGPRLVVTWSGLRPIPLAPEVAPDVAEPGAEQPAMEEAAQPAFEWRLPGVAPAQTRFRVQVSADGFETLIADSGKVSGRRGTSTEWLLPRGSLSESGEYQWRVRVRLGEHGWSEWSVPQTFSWSAPQPMSPPAPLAVPAAVL